jgi:hypothetical protein
MKELDLTEIAHIVSDMARRMLSGEQIEKEEITVKVKVWKPVLDAINKVSEITGVEPEVAVTQLVQEGLNTRLQAGYQQAQQQTPPKQEEPNPEILKDLGIDVSGLMSGLNKLSGLTQQLQGMQDILGKMNINDAQATTPPKTNHKKDNQ